MRREGIQDKQELAQGRDRSCLRGREGVYENHHLRDGGVKGERLNVLGNFLDRGVDDFLLRAG